MLSVGRQKQSLRDRQGIEVVSPEASRRVRACVDAFRQTVSPVEKVNLQSGNEEDQPAVSCVDVDEATIKMSDANRRAVKPERHLGSVESSCWDANQNTIQPAS